MGRITILSWNTHAISSSLTVLMMQQCDLCAHKTIADGVIHARFSVGVSLPSLPV